VELADKEFVDFEAVVDLSIEVVDFAVDLVVGAVVVFVVGVDSLAVADTVVALMAVVALVAER
jgi:hypothetical protein